METLAVSGRMLMEVAGRAVARFCASQVPPGSSVAVACGPGNNGGDGFVAARALAARGFQVQTFAFCPRQRYRNAALEALTALEATVGPPVFVTNEGELHSFARALQSCRLAIDALLGIGTQEPVRGLLDDSIRTMNHSAVPIVSVDLPSGIHTDTGTVLGQAVQAAHTVTFGFAKRCHYAHPGAQLRGTLHVRDIGLLSRAPSDAAIALRPSDLPTLLPKRRRDSHKGDFGHVVVVAGSVATPGAAILALQGALSVGAGLVRWGTQGKVLAHAPNRPPEVMLAMADGPAKTQAQHYLRKASALVIGPGLGTEPESLCLLEELLRRSRVPTCLDADALNLLADHPQLWELVTPSTVLTPHPKEMARLTQSTTQGVQADRFASAHALATNRQCVVVLKGAGTVVAAPNGQLSIIDAGNPGMASGGTGDVLAGMLGGLLAQKLLAPPLAARIAVLAHAAAGDEAAKMAGEAGMCASDLVGCIKKIWATCNL